jgi:hypothetical protein
MTDEQLALALYAELYGGGTELHLDRLWGFGVASVRRSCLERPVETVLLAGGAL